jgi:peptidylprolyl isomerase
VATTKQRERELARLRMQRQAARRAAARARARRRAAIAGSVVGVVAVLAAVALLAGLGGGSAPKTTAGAKPSGSAAPSAAAFPPVPPGADPRLRTKPVLGAVRTPPQKLVVKDLIVGTGAVAKPGSTLTVNYVGAHLDGKEFDSSWTARRTFNVVDLGQARVIAGWNQGLIGMKVGGRRDLLIPAALAYGAGGQGDIKPNEPLHFVVDLLAVK